MGDRYIKPFENKKIIYFDANNLYGHSVSQMLPYDEVQMWNGHRDFYMDELEAISNIPDDTHIGYFLENVLNYCDLIKQKTRSFPFCPEKKVSLQN